MFDTDEDYLSDIPAFTDKKGMQYRISEEEYRNAIDQRRPSRRKEIELTIAKELLNSNLQRLTGKQREVMYYKMLGYTTQRTAKELSISVGAVNSHLKLAKKKLAHYIEGTRKLIEGGYNDNDGD